MSRISLSDTGDWQLVHDSQDIRGYSVVDASGQPVGTIASMIVDTDAELVTTLVLDDGTEVPTADVTIGDNVVYLGSAAPAAASDATAAYDRGHVVRREHVANVNDTFDADFDGLGDDFRAHHAATYGAQGREYDTDLEAYRYGYTSAHAEPYRNRAYTDSETELQSGYPRDYDADREAVRYGYDRAQRRRS